MSVVRGGTEEKQVSDYPKVCKLCLFAKPIDATGDCLCKYEGVVCPGHTCEKFVFDYLRLKPKRRKKPVLSKFSPDDFSIE